MSTAVANTSYINARFDLLALIPDEPIAEVLDLGCANGATGEALKRQRAGAHITGIELDEHLAGLASQRLDRVIHADCLQGLNTLLDEGHKFDLVLCGDILEHLVDPWAALRIIRQLTRGCVIVSLPNVAHFSTIWSLLVSKRFPYRDRGIHDRTHLRFFAAANLPELFAEAEFEEVSRKVAYRLIETPHPLNEKMAPLLAVVPGLRGLTSYQFLSLLRPA
jgi:2-polyprenyl-3-methyl-5-hydroxy-6-metoxy-1,4-benzoquinol methylase